MQREWRWMVPVGGTFLLARAAIASVTLGTGMMSGNSIPLDISLMPGGIKPAWDLQTLTDPMRNMPEFSAHNGIGMSLELDMGCIHTLSMSSTVDDSVVYQTGLIDSMPGATEIPRRLGSADLESSGPDLNLLRIDPVDETEQGVQQTDVRLIFALERR